MHWVVRGRGVGGSMPSLEGINPTQRQLVAVTENFRASDASCPILREPGNPNILVKSHAFYM